MIYYPLETMSIATANYFSSLIADLASSDEGYDEELQLGWGKSKTGNEFVYTDNNLINQEIKNIQNLTK